MSTRLQQCGKDFYVFQRGLLYQMALNYDQSEEDGAMAPTEDPDMFRVLDLDVGVGVVPRDFTNLHTASKSPGNTSGTKRRPKLRAVASDKNPPKPKSMQSKASRRTKSQPSLAEAVEDCGHAEDVGSIEWPSQSSQDGPVGGSAESERSQPYASGYPPQQLLNWTYRGSKIVVRADKGELGKWQGKWACLLKFYVHVSGAEKLDRLHLCFKFMPAHDSGAPRGPIKIFAIGPEEVYGEQSVDHRVSSVGGDADVTGGMPIGASGTLGVHINRESSQDIRHQQRLHGWFDCSKKGVSRVNWEVTENGRTKTGIPSHLCLMTVVQCKSDKGIKVTASTKSPWQFKFCQAEVPYVVQPAYGGEDFSEWDAEQWRATGMTYELETRFVAPLFLEFIRENAH
jgi:hypothetical protein